MRLKRVLAAVPIVTALGLGMGNAMAAGYTVCATHCAFSSVQAAVDAAPAGSTILIMQGTYHENISISKSLSLTGAGFPGTVVLDGSGSDVATVSGGSVTFANMTIQGGGVGVKVTGGSLALRGVTVRSNAAGGISVGPSGTLSLINDSVTGNTTQGNGAGLDVQGTVSQILSSTFAGNSAPRGQGGAIAVEPSGQILSMQGVSLSSNNALMLGGGLWVGGSVANASYVTATHNTVSEMYGGGLYITGTMSLSNLTATYNSAPVDGGAFDVDGGGRLTLTGGTLSFNSAAYGGAVAVYGTLSMSGTTLSNNSASFGGALFNFAYLTMQNTTMSGNHARDGGAIYDEDGFSASGLTLTGNTATSDGGAIFNMFNNETLTSLTISSNRAGAVAGAIYNDGGALSSTMGSVVSNIATVGGGIVNCNGTLALSGTTVSLNQPNNELDSCAS